MPGFPLDLKSGYWQLKIRPEDREKTAFSVGNGLWQFVAMSFGLCNAPATFERLMERVLRSLLSKICLIYLDDEIVFGKTFEKMKENLREVLLKFRAAKLSVNPKKCNLFRRQVKYLGHVVSSAGIATDPEKTEAVTEWLVQNKKQVRSFLGFCSYYRKFVKGFSSIAKPLFKLTENLTKFDWTGQCQIAFLGLKQALTSAPLLSFPKGEGKMILDTHASGFGIGAVLSQVQDGYVRVIAYYSRVLNKPERNYCTTRRELLALGIIHGNTDGLSRRPCVEEKCRFCSKVEVQRELFEDKIVARIVLREDSSEDWRRAQIEDQELAMFLLAKENDMRPSWEEVSSKGLSTKIYWHQWHALEVQNGILHKRWEAPNLTNSFLQLMIPRSKVKQILEEAHDTPSGGHFGINKTLEKIRKRFYWATCKKDVEEWCRTCKICIAKRSAADKGKSPLQIFNSGAPFERIQMDILGPLPVSSSGNNYLLVVVDCFTKWVEAFPLKNMRATTVAEIFVQVVSRYGVPLELHTDQGRNFESQLFQELMRILGIRKTRTALHPQSDGQVERQHQTILQYLSKTSKHEATGVTPSEGVTPSFVLRKRSYLADGFAKRYSSQFGFSESAEEYVRNLRQKLDEIHQRVRERLESRSLKIKCRYDRKARHPVFEEGQKVWLFNPHRKKDRSPKLQNDWEGPFEIIKKISDVVFCISRSGGRKSKVVHADRCRPQTLGWSDPKNIGDILLSHSASAQKVCAPPSGRIVSIASSPE
ncbi:uncharacterized protein LOC105425493 [Pogonomyrmex barbatus]|uniref:RNA-directed DNA polymerase n=1 Tax=Pogonomyrmex barbatus TaxID=144034 RepID=A0A6I9W7G8_9HYME|nr:uncharacterized protein LOC105425493 [Pogonomyrmex barbatus]